MRYTLLILLVIVTLVHSGCRDDTTPEERDKMIAKAIRNNMLQENKGLNLDIAVDTVIILQTTLIDRKTVLKKYLYCKNYQRAEAMRDVHSDSALVAFWENRVSGAVTGEYGDTIKYYDGLKEHAAAEIQQLTQGKRYKENQAAFAALCKTCDSLGALLPTADSVVRDNFSAFAHISYRHWPLGKWYTRRVTCNVYFFLDNKYHVVCSLNKRYNKLSLQ